MWILRSLEGGTKYPWEELHTQSEELMERLSRDCPNWGSIPNTVTKSRHYFRMPRSACWQEPDVAVSWEALPVPDKYRDGCSQPAVELSTGSPRKELQKGLKSWRGLQTHRRNNNMNQPVTPELPGTKPPTKENTWWDSWLQLHM